MLAFLYNLKVHFESYTIHLLPFLVHPTVVLYFSFLQHAAIASAVLAIAIPSVCLSVRPSVTRRYCVKTTHVAWCSLHFQTAKCVQYCRNQKIFPRDNTVPMKSWLQLTYPRLIAASLDINQGSMLPLSSSKWG